MAEILIKIKIEGNSNALAFVERTQPYLSKTLKEIRQDIVSEVGELLPQNFKFVRTGIPVSAIQEEKLHLQKCIGEEESGKVFSLSIQVHNRTLSHNAETKDFARPTSHPVRGWTGKNKAFCSPWTQNGRRVIKGYSLENKDSREISTQSSSKKSISLNPPLASKDGQDAFEKTTRQIQCEVESLEDDIQLAQAKLHSFEEIPSHSLHL